MDFSKIKAALNRQNLAKTFDHYIGDEKTDNDSIVPTTSPIDVLAGGAGGALGKSLAQGAGDIVGNEIGSIGYTVKPNNTFAQRVAQNAQEAAPGLVQKTEQALPVNPYQEIPNMGLAGKAEQSNALLNAAQQAAEKEETPGPNLDQLKAILQKRNRDMDALAKNQAAIAQRRAAAINKLRSSQ